MPHMTKKEAVAYINAQIAETGGWNREVPLRCDFCGRWMEGVDHNGEGRPIARGIIKLGLGDLQGAVLYTGKCCREELRLNLIDFIDVRHKESGET